MDVAYIRTLYRYDRWANDRMLGTVANLSAEQFTKPMGSSHKSVRDTAVHILSSEDVWLQRWNGTSPPGMMDPGKFPDIASVRAGWSKLEKAQDSFLSLLDEQALRTPVNYTNLEGKAFSIPLWQQMGHVVNHASYHRGQITTLLRQLGAQPIATDLIVFFRENPQA